VANLLPLLTRTSLAVFLSAALIGCTSDDDSDGTLSLVTGQESDAWTLDPAAATVQVDMVQAGTHTPLTTVPAPPADDVSLGSGGPENVAVNFEATAFDASQNPVMHGVSPAFTLQGFVDTAFFVFLGRTGFSRPSGSLLYEHRHPLLTVWPNQYLFITGSDTQGSDPANLDVYDIAVASMLELTPNFPQATTSSVASGTTLLLLGDTDIWFDLSSSTSETATPPGGLAFSEVTGGRTLIAPNGTAYLVGATRSTGDPTDKVLQVNADGTLYALVLSTPRLGAAASFVEGSLVVAGGSASGAGAEVLAPSGSSFSALALPADATQGAGLAELTPTSAILAGGQDPTSGAASPTRSIDLTCTSDCTATELSSLDLNLVSAQVFPVATNELLVVGETADAVTHAYVFDVSSASPVSTEQTFREPRAGASAVMLTNGQVAVVGGDDPTSGAGIASMELFFP
jgi:hypothetical protein